MAFSPKILDLSEDIRNFLFSEEVFDVYSEIKESFSLAGQADVPLSEKVGQVLTGDLPLSDLPVALQKDFPNLSPESSQKLSIKLLLDLFLEKPIKGFLPGVEEQIVAWGGVLPELSLDEKTEEVAKKFDDKLAGDAERARLRFLLKGFFAEERTEDVLLSFLGKDQKLGGLTVAPELAQEIILEAKKMMDVRRVKPLEEIEISERTETPEETEASEELELPEVVEAVEEPEQSKMTEENIETEESPEVVEKKIEPESVEVIKEITKSEPSDVVEKMIEPVIEPESSEVVDVVTGPESEELLDVLVEPTPEPEAAPEMEPVPVLEPELESPVEMEKIEAPEVFPMIDEHPHDLLTSDDHEELNNHAEKASIISANTESTPVADLDGHVTKTLESLSSLQIDAAAKENLAKIVKDRVSGIQDPYTTRTKIGRAVAEGGVGLSGLDLANAMQAIEDGFNEHQDHVLIKMKEVRKAELRDLREQREKPAQEPEKVTNAQNQQKPSPNIERATTRMSTGSIPASSLPKPQVTDVRFVPRLAGPTEELRRMGITEFRRIAKDPNNVIERILDKIDSLAETGYDKKIVGIKAWRESPVNQLYLRMTQEALTTDVSIEAVSKSFADRGEDFLTPEEVRAIVRLNGRLRF